MSLFKITEDMKSMFTMETHPQRTYISSSVSGSVGSVNVFARRSSIEKEVQPLSMFSSSFYNDENLEQVLEVAKFIGKVSGSNEKQILGYLETVYQQQPSARKQQQVDIFRFNPPFSFNKNTSRKLAIINTTMPFYRPINSNYNYNVSNYFSLNFFTESNHTGQEVLLYPNPITNIYSNGQYTPENAWSFDFWINPKYTELSTNTYKPGVIFHLSGVYCVSLISGSSVDYNGYINKFGIMIQVSNSADISPSLVNINSPQQNIFIASNCLEYNKWNHVTIRHGGTNPLYNFGTGSIVVNGDTKSTFVLTSSLTTGNFGNAGGPRVLAIGNYYEGTNSGSAEMVKFFAANTTIREGLYELNSDTVDNPSDFSFTHPLNAEIHELKIYNKYLNDYDLSLINENAPTSLNNLLFYVPPFFTYESPTRSFYLGEGGVPVTPFQTKDDSTHDMFNVTMSFSVGGQFMNIENFTKDFATGFYPRLLNLTSSIIQQTTDILSANEFLYASGSNQYRQYFIMPCDNGLFYPNYNFLNTYSQEKFLNDLGHYNKGKITLRNLIPDFDKASTILRISGAIEDDFIGPSPSNISGSYSDTLAIYHRTRDNSSNQCVIFDISNIFYGEKITPKSLSITDNNLSGSGGKIRITLKDDGYGGLYRADSNSANAEWSNVGNVFYNEGIVLIKSPQLYFFGQEQFNLTFKGQQNIYVLKFNLFLNPLTATSSSNPTYTNMSSSLANENDEQYVWLSGLYVHDENMNVIMKTNFAQPVKKKTGDKFRFDIKTDF